MEHLLHSLNNEQKKAVTAINGPVLVIAGAGTGKTKVITSRIAWMIYSGIKPESIVAVSFTNKAAKEMYARLASLIGEKIAKKVELSTFHSFALKILRKYYNYFSLNKDFSISDENESLNILKDSLKELNLEEILSIQEASQKISFYKDNLYTEDDFKKNGNIFDAKILAKLFNSYNRRLRLYNLIDFDDIVYLTLLGIKKNNELLNNIQSKILYLMVDEYQDTSYAQFNLICTLSSKLNNVCVVGDDDQSIYSWRGARPSVISDFIKHFPECSKITLEQNYRCSPNILNAANSVIRENTERLGKELWSKQPNLHPITIYSSENERDESIFVAETISKLKKEIHNFTFEQVAVLVRSNKQTIPIEQVFIEKQIPYKIYGGNEFFDRKEVKDLFSYLKLAHNENDLNSLFRIINTPSRGIGITTLEKIKNTYNQQTQKNNSTDFKSVLSILAKEHKGIEDFLNNWNKFGEKLKQGNNIFEISNYLRECYENLGLKKEILSTSVNMQVAKFRIELVEKVFSVIERLELREENIQAVIDALHLDRDFFGKSQESTNKVQVMTMHSSKGLEFPNVFLIGVEEGIIPHEKSIPYSHLVEEERRLFYVAITRAKYRLFISHCGFRKQGRANHNDIEPKKSRFLSAIPNNLIKIDQTDPNSEEAKRMDAARKLFELFR
jgi:superfamily I DNA/RNA helicase